MSIMRILVSHPRPVDPSDPPVVPVGIARGTGRDRLPSVIVKATFTYAGQVDGTARQARLAAAQEPISLSVPSPLSYASSRELFYPTDFVPPKSRCDVLVVGHAFAPEVTDRIVAGFSAAGVTRHFAVITSDPAETIPLAQAYLRSEADDEARVDPVGPIVLDEEDEADEEEEDPDDDEDEREDDVTVVAIGGRAQSAPASQQGKLLRSDEVIELIGLSPRAPRLSVALPGISPRVLAEVRGRLVPVEVQGDTLWIDTDREIIVVTWRGHIGEGIRALVVSLERTDAPRSDAAIRSAVARGAASLAVTEEDLQGGGAAPAISAEETALVRYSAWGTDAPPPSIPLEVYASLSAELAEGREPRARILERSALDEDAWMLEERAWLEAMGQAAMEGDGTLAVAYGDLFIAAQERLADPTEEARTLEEYVAIRAAFERAEDPPAALKDRGMTLSAWMRLDRRWTARAGADPEIAREIARLLEIAHAEIEDAPPSSEEAP